MHSPHIASHLYLLISVLGPLQVRLGTALITRFEFERVRALLLYLAVEGISHERAWLAYMFWPDAPLKTGLQNVRQTLAALKRTLQDTQRSVPLLETTPTTIGLNSEAGYSLDVDDFATMISEADHHAHRRLDSCGACMTRLEHAVALYRGDFARGVTVDSEPFEEWLLQKQEQLHSQATRALSTLTEYYSHRQEYGKTIQAARHLLTLDPLSDVGHHHLIQALAGDHQRHAALKQCRSYETLLHNELGLCLPTHTAQLQRFLASESWDPWILAHPPQHNLPKPLSPIVGYEHEQDIIHERLASTDCRLLTLSGMAGVGKTRLATECAWGELTNYADGVFFVELEGTAPNEVMTAIAGTLLPPADLDSKAPQRLHHYLRDKEMLLVLDGFDHLIQSDAACLRRLLRDAPRLQLMVTSRERLNLQGESGMDIKGLEFPTRTTVRRLDAYDAVRFFVQRVHRWQPDFVLDNEDDRAAVFQMCQNVGGNPRALDLYAQVSRFFPLPQVVQDLDLQQLTDWGEALNRDLPTRHRSLKALFYASWRQLTQEERRALISLSIFEGSFTLAAAGSVTQSALDVVLSLQAKSCLTVSGPIAMLQLIGAEEHSTTATTRYRLPELLRYYLRQTLEGEPPLLQKVGRSHAMYYMEFLSQSVEGLATERGSVAILKLMRAERENVDQAIAWATQTGNAMVRAQMEQNLTLAHVYESRLRNAGWEGTERQTMASHREWA